MVYLELFWEFFKTGLFSVGGGLATLPFLYDMAENKPWFTVEELTNMIAVSESTPGPMGVNMATYVGFHTAGVLGAVMATFALVLPSLLIVLMIARVLEKFQRNRLVQDLFSGLRPAAVGLMTAAVLPMICSSLFAGGQLLLSALLPVRLVLFAALLFAVFKWKKHPVVYIGSAAVVGILLKL